MEGINEFSKSPEDKMEQEINDLAQDLGEKVAQNAEDLFKFLTEGKTMTFSISFKLEGPPTKSYQARAEKVSSLKAANCIKDAVKQALLATQPKHDTGNKIVFLKYEYIFINADHSEGVSGERGIIET